MSLLNNLVGYWKLDEASGAAIDANGTRHLVEWDYNADAALGGAAGSAAGILNNCRTIANTGSAPKRALRLAVVIGSAYTVAGWVKLSSASNYSVLFHFVGGSGEHTLYNDSSGGLKAFDGSNVFIPVKLLSDATWAFVAMTFDGTTTQVRLNGTTASTTSLSSSGHTAFMLDGDIAASSPTVSFDETGLWQRVLDAAELDTLYGSGTPPGFGVFQPDLLLPQICL